MKQPRIDIIHQRDPDSECYIEVYIDGVLASHLDGHDVHEHSFDPGAGYEMDEYDEQAREHVASVPDFLKPVIEGIYDDMRPTYERWGV